MQGDNGRRRSAQSNKEPSKRGCDIWAEHGQQRHRMKGTGRTKEDSGREGKEGWAMMVDDGEGGWLNGLV